MKDLFDKNLKSLKKEVEEDTRKWKDSPCSWIGRVNIIKIDNPTKSSLYNFNTIPIKISTQFFTDLEIIILNSIWKNKKTQDIQYNPVQ